MAQEPEGWHSGPHSYQGTSPWSRDAFQFYAPFPAAFAQSFVPLHRSSFALIDTSDDADTDLQWNFEKFLIDKEGKVVHRWASTTTPESIDAEIAKLL